MFSAPMVIWGTLLQRRVPAHMLGRVASLDFFISVSLMPVSMALAAPIADLLGLRTTFYIAGIVPGVLAIVAIIWARMPAGRDRAPDDRRLTATSVLQAQPTAVSCSASWACRAHHACPSGGSVWIGS